MDIQDETPQRGNWGDLKGMGTMGLPLQHAPEPAWSDLWSAVRDRLRLEVGQGIFDTWIAPLSLPKAEKRHVRLSAPTTLARDYGASPPPARRDRHLAGAGQGLA